MKTHTEICSVKFSSAQMFDLVSDIESYPNFLPWCVGARILSREANDQIETIKADLVIAFGAYREKFCSHIFLNKSTGLIEIVSREDTFKHLQARWEFIEEKPGCEIRFSTQFKFRNMLLDKLIGFMFFKAIKRIVNAFKERAELLYSETQ